MLPINNSFNYTCNLGKKKKVKFRPWKTKDEKAFLTFIETVDKVTDKDFYEYLIRPCLENPNMFFSSAEVQALLIEIRKVSMGESFDLKFICKNDDCKRVNELTVEFIDITNFKEDSVSIFDNNNLKITFGDIKNVDTFHKKIENQNAIEQVFIEMIMRIEKIELNTEMHDSFTYEEVYEFIDNLDVKDFDALLKFYNENRASISLKGEFECMFCKHPNKFLFDEIPNFLAGW